ncbi:MAG: hypothetical protein ACK55Z_18065, partial [bacterium]
TPSISMRRESLIFWYNRTATSDPMSSILGMEILHLGATLVFPARRRQSTEPSPKMSSMGFPFTGPLPGSGHIDRGKLIFFKSFRCPRTSRKFASTWAGT